MYLQVYGSIHEHTKCSAPRAKFSLRPSASTAHGLPGRIPRVWEWEWYWTTTPDRASITPKQPLLLSLSDNMLVHSHLILNSGLSTPLIGWWWVPKLFMQITAVVAARLSIYPNHNSTCSSYEGMAKDPQSCVKDVQNRHTSQQTNKVSPALLEYTTSRL